MIKIIFSPLFFFLLCFLIFGVYFFFKRKLSSFSILFLSIVFGFFFFFCTPFASSFLYKGLELSDANTKRCPSDAVVVLSSGYYPSTEKNEKSVLDGESMLRISKGVEIFQRCRPQFLVLSGALQSSKYPLSMQTDLMREFALHLGVPERHILLESQSLNTMQHVKYLQQLNKEKLFGDIAIVTSPWHLKRAMTEFWPVFPKAFPVAAYPFARDTEVAFHKFLPQANFLASSTHLLQEYIGMAYYKLFHIIKDDV